MGVQKAKERRTWNATIPKPLPRKRRALSISTGEPQINNMGLFSRLPFELRHAIYVYAIGNRLLHVTHVPRQRRMGHFDDDWTDAYPFYTSPGEVCQSNGKTALLKTCRQIYLEAAPVLYTTNTLAGLFYAHRWADFTYFFPTIRPYRLASMSSLYIRCPSKVLRPFASSSIKKRWRLLCNSIATKMSGLRHFHLALCETLEETFPLSLEEQWIQPMLQIHGLLTLRLEIEPYPHMASFSTRYCDEIDRLKRDLERKMCNQN